MAYRSQYADQPTGGGLFVPQEEIRERTFAEARHYGLLAGVEVKPGKAPGVRDLVFPRVSSRVLSGSGPDPVPDSGPDPV